MTIDEILEALDGEIARLREARELLSSVDVQARRSSVDGGGAVLRAIMSQATPGPKGTPGPKKRVMSAEGRARIAAAQRERWAKRNGPVTSAPVTSGKSSASTKKKAAVKGVSGKRRGRPPGSKNA